MFLDEDGDVAHEFYEEVQPDNGRPWMKQITDGLIWQVKELTDEELLIYDF